MKKREVEVVQALRNQIRMICKQIDLVQPRKTDVEELKALGRESTRLLSTKGFGSDVLKEYEEERTRKEKQVRTQGAKAYEEGKGRDACPFRGGGYWHYLKGLWLEGWDAAKKASEG